MTYDIAEDIWDRKYRFKSDKGDEPNRSATFRRVARALAVPEKDSKYWEDEFFRITDSFKFIPAGRILAGAGTNRNVTLFNCFVMDTIQDSMQDIFRNLSETAITLQAGGGIGHCFSTLRPKGSKVKGVGADSSGPVAFMDIWDSMCRSIKSAGARRGAMMATLACNHPDIEEFIEAKRTKGRLTNFNVSVLITDEFMNAVKNDSDWHLTFNTRVYKTLKARELWDKIIKSCYDYAEPGVIFIDRVNDHNNLNYCESITATNPCSEQPLPPYAACLLGSINLTAFVDDAFTERAHFNHQEFDSTIRIAVRMLDNVTDVSKFPLLDQGLQATKKRRMGLGITGLADTLAMIGHRYDSKDGLRLAENIMYDLHNTAYDASADLANEKGSYPVWDFGHFKKSSSYHKLTDTVKEKIEKHGLRNSHLTSIAPTGTISLFANNISSGIEPIFALSYKRKILENDGSKTEVEVRDYAYDLFEKSGSTRNAFVTAQELKPIDHINMLAVVQKWCDSSISKTINVPKDFPFEDFKNLYTLAYDKGCKGCTAYRPNDIIGSVITVDKPDSNTRDKDSNTRDKVLPGKTYKIKWANDPHAIYVTINDNNNKPFEIFINTKNTDHIAWTTALTRMLSAVFRREEDIAFVIEELRSVYDPKGGAFYEGAYEPSLVSIIGGIIEMHISDLGLIDKKRPVKIEGDTLPQCPNCHQHSIVRVENCDRCLQCDYSKCS